MNFARIENCVCDITVHFLETIAVSKKRASVCNCPCEWCIPF